MFESHVGLSDRYRVSCAELDFLVDLAREFSGNIGARMMGGGFGGCTINLIENDSIEVFTTLATSKYQEAFGSRLETYLVRSSEGAHVVTLD